MGGGGGRGEGREEREREEGERGGEKGVYRRGEGFKP